MVMNSINSFWLSWEWDPNHSNSYCYNEYFKLLLKYLWSTYASFPPLYPLMGTKVKNTGLWNYYSLFTHSYVNILVNPLWCKVQSLQTVKFFQMGIEIDLNQKQSVYYIKVNSNRTELQKTLFHDYRFKLCSLKKICIPFMFYVWTYIKYIFLDIVLYRRICILHFHLILYCKCFLDVNYNFHKIFLNNNASWWLWILVADWWQWLCSCLVANLEALLLELKMAFRNSL